MEEDEWELFSTEGEVTLWHEGERRIFMDKDGMLGIELNGRSMTQTLEMWHQNMDELDGMSKKLVNAKLRLKEKEDSNIFNQRSE